VLQLPTSIKCSSPENKSTCPKWWHTTKENVKYHSCTPDINFGTIVSL
jgi:hypothetical protein